MFILCSQKDAKNSKLWYLRFWSSIFSRTELTHQVFLSNPFAPSPATSPGCTNGLARHQNQSEPLDVQGHFLWSAVARHRLSFTPAQTVPYVHEN